MATWHARKIKSDNETNFKNKLRDTGAKEHSIKCVYHIPYHAQASWKTEKYNGLLKTALRTMGSGTFKNWDSHLAEAAWLVSTRGSFTRARSAQSELLSTVERDKLPAVHTKK